MKKKLLIASVLAMATVSGSVLAAVTNGQLTFNWQGGVPSAPVTKNTWAFVNGLDIPFTPGTEQLNITLGADKGITARSVKPYDFFIVPVTGTVTAGSPVTRSDTTSMNSVKAFLSSEPVSNGFVGNKQLTLSTTAEAVTGQVAITLNGQPLKVGSANATTVAMDTNKKESHISIDMNAKASASDVAEGSAINFVAPVTFAVDI
ncbi:CS7 fimbrial biogenesis major subunit CsvA [Escherichia coli]|uniref:CS7 fimbrial biogenesis major subunit CsvA n=1 Tax=Escherichia coli TaxID=562 RepID=UPI00050B2853|nr:CS7 fimbrial biogenesis major subunit CsvA [Escherichia coli]